jgi:hypothetical protein
MHKKTADRMGFWENLAVGGYGANISAAIGYL